MINKEDFIFIKKDSEDYWFKLSGETKNYITDCTYEMCMIETTEIVYSKDENIIGVKRLFPFNYDVLILDPSDKLFKELFPIIKILIKE